MRTNLLIRCRSSETHYEAYNKFRDHAAKIPWRVYVDPYKPVLQAANHALDLKAKFFPIIEMASPRIVVGGPPELLDVLARCALHVETNSDIQPLPAAAERTDDRICFTLSNSDLLSQMDGSPKGIMLIGADSSAMGLLTDPANWFLLVDSALPMAMALVASEDDLKIVGFLDMALVRRRQTSLKLYHHRSLGANTGKVDLFVPSLHSMTSVVALNYLKTKNVGIKDFYELGGFDAIIERIAKLEKLETAVWVLDEGSTGAGRGSDHYHESLITRLGRFRFEKEVLFFNGWEEFFKQIHLAPEFMTAHIPGMVLLAHGDHLRDQGARNLAHKFLQEWIVFRGGEGYTLVESKALGPFSWEDYKELLNFRNFSMAVFKAADSRLGIERPMLVHCDFDDVTPPEDRSGTLRVFDNLCVLLNEQVNVFSSVASLSAAHVQTMAEVLKKEVEVLRTLQDQISAVRSRLVLAGCDRGEPVPVDKAEIAIMLNRACNAEDGIAESLRVIKQHANKAQEQMYGDHQDHRPL